VLDSVANLWCAGDRYDGREADIVMLPVCQDQDVDPTNDCRHCALSGSCYPAVLKCNNDCSTYRGCFEACGDSTLRRQSWHQREAERLDAEVAALREMLETVRAGSLHGVDMTDSLANLWCAVRAMPAES
jgi:hypothetical protein